MIRMTKHEAEAIIERLRWKQPQLIWKLFGHGAGPSTSLPTPLWFEDRFLCCFWSCSLREATSELRDGFRVFREKIEALDGVEYVQVESISDIEKPMSNTLMVGETWLIRFRLQAVQ